MIGEVDGATDIAKLKVFYEFVIGRKTARRAAESACVVPVKEFANRTPFPRTRDDRAADFEQGLGLRAPQAARGETPHRFKMEVKARRVNVFASMRKAHGDVCLVGTLVMRESHVAVDAKQGTARGARIGDKKWRNLG